MQDRTQNKLGPVLLKLEKDGVHQDNTLMRELRNRILDYSKKYTKALREYHGKTYNKITEREINNLENAIKKLNHKKDMLYHRIATELADFYKTFNEKLGQALAPEDLSRAISQNPSCNASDEEVAFEGNDRNFEESAKFENSEPQRPQNSETVDLSSVKDMTPSSDGQALPSFSNNHVSMSVTNEPNLNGGCLGGDANSEIILKKPIHKKITIGKIVTAVKEKSESGMSIWAGGFQEMMLMVNHNEEIRSAFWEESEFVITQIVRLKNIFLLITDKGKVMILSQGGDLLRQMHLGELFQRDESVCSHITFDDYVIIFGTTIGRIIVTLYHREDESLSVSYKEQEHSRAVTSFLWEDEDQRTFFSGSYDRYVNKIRLTEDFKLEVFMKFKYEESIMSMINLHKYIILGMSNSTFSIIEPKRGNIVLVMTSKDFPGIEKVKSAKYAIMPGLTNLGFIYKATEKELEYLAGKSTMSKKNFEQYISRLRILALSENNVLHVIGFPQNHPDNQQIQLFSDLGVSKNTHNLPLIIERINPNKLRVRVVGSSHWRSRGITDSKGPSWISETEIELRPGNHMYNGGGLGNMDDNGYPIRQQSQFSGMGMGHKTSSYY